MIALIARELGLSSGIAALVTGLYALNPVAIFSGASGMSETTFGFFASIALYGLVRFHRRADSKALLITGLALGACMACRYETLVLGPTFGVCMGIMAGRSRWRMAAVIVTLPTFVVFGLWTLASELIQGDGFFWYRYAEDLDGDTQGRALACPRVSTRPISSGTRCAWCWSSRRRSSCCSVPASPPLDSTGGRVSGWRR